MATRKLRWRLAAAVAALAIVISVVAVGLSRRGSSPAGGAAPTTVGGATGPTSTTTLGAAGSAADIAAARACQAFTVYLDDAREGRIPAAAGRALIEDAATLLRGSQQDQAAGRALPPWATLGSDLLASAEDVVAHKSAALQTDGAAAGAQCRTVPASAARAGGFERGG